MTETSVPFLIVALAGSRSGRKPHGSDPRYENTKNTKKTHWFFRLFVISCLFVEGRVQRGHTPRLRSCGGRVTIRES